MASITTWTRLEPRTRSHDGMDAGLQARLLDPLWMLTRQWHLGEFQAEDAGSAVAATAQVASGPLSRYRAAGAPAAQDYPRTAPLESLVQRDQVARGTGALARLAVDMGLHFLRLLDAQPNLKHYRGGYLAAYPLTAPAGSATVDSDASRYLGVMAGRALDGGRLYHDLFAALVSPGGGTLPASPPVAPGQAGAVVALATAWLNWCTALLDDRPADAAAWDAQRMEYAFAVSAQVDGGRELTLAADAYRGDPIDWHTFDGDFSAPLGATAAPATSSVCVVPSPVRFPGMPAPRWWQLEDAHADLGSIDVTRDDLARLVLMEFGLVYGNDWFLVPLPLPVGTLSRVTALTLTDAFGQTEQVPHYAGVDGPGGDWRVFALSPERPQQAGAPDLAGYLCLPPAAVTTLAGPDVEEVRFLRDDMAILAWGVEHQVEGQLGRPLDRVETYQAQQRSTPPAAPPPGAPDLAYRLETQVPPYWIPLRPVRVTTPTNPSSLRLQRAALLGSGGNPAPEPPLGRVLEPDMALVLFDHEIPQEGLRVTRGYRYARWTDGSAHFWAGRTRGPGRGQGSSGLRFDLLERT
jgi:hypothetical protein